MFLEMFVIVSIVWLIMLPFVLMYKMNLSQDVMIKDRKINTLQYSDNKSDGSLPLDSVNDIQWTSKNCNLKTETIVCWEVEHFHDNILEELFVTECDGFGGYELISCLHCGQIYSVRHTPGIYVVPLSDVLKRLDCINCNSNLSETSHKYPDKYLSVNGKVIEYYGSSFIHPDFIPPIPEMRSDETSLLKNFYSIYTVFEK